MCLAIIFLLPIPGLAAGPPVPSEMSNTIAQVLLLVIGALLLAIVMLAQVVIGAAEVYTTKYKKEKKAKETNPVTVLLILFFLSTISTTAMAAEVPAVASGVASSNFGGLSALSFYTLLSIIGLELLLILVLLYNLKLLLAEKSVITTTIAPEKVRRFSWRKWWEKINSFRPVHEESNIDLGHSYDGIRELDNRLPPWWLYGFYLSILFAFVYVWRFHIAHSAPLSHEELRLALIEAEVEKDAYLKNAANKVDENTVLYLSDASSLAAGKAIFSTTCMACHLADGGGSVGPNLTDKYWLHGGSIKDIFKTIKYGWPEKGMKSWKDDYSPVQIAQLASYVKSLTGTKPEKPKDPEGVLYQETIEPPAGDSSLKAGTAVKKAGVIP